MTPIYFLVEPSAPNTPPQADAAEPVAARVHEELARILASPQFRKAPRTRALLRFLVLQMTEGKNEHINEYEIGVNVFRRKAGDYDPGEDPIVRVQVGRLRAKLASYYAQEGLGNGLRIQIPPGRYRPCVVATGQSIRAGVTFHPLACLSDDQRAHTFTHGLNDELGYRLHRVFQTPPRSAGVPAQAPDTSYTLEGSVRLEAQHLRTSIRLTDRGTGSIIWSEQLDHGFDLPIARQEQLATICCHVLCLRLGCGQRRETAG